MIFLDRFGVADLGVFARFGVDLDLALLLLGLYDLHLLFDLGLLDVVYPHDLHRLFLRDLLLIFNELLGLLL